MAGARETIAILSRREGIFSWGRQSRVKRIDRRKIQTVVEEKLKENIKQLTKNIEILVDCLETYISWKVVTKLMKQNSIDNVEKPEKSTRK